MRWIVRIAVLLLLLAGLALAGLMLVPGERIARIAERRFEAATGRALTMSGDVGATIYPQLGIRIGRVEVANAEWSDAGPMLTAEGARVGVDLMALVSGAVRIREVEVINPALRLEAAGDGRTNWDFGTGNGDGGAEVGAEQASGTLPAFALERGIVTGGQVSYVNRATGQDTNLTGLDMELRLPSFEGPATVDMTALLRGQPQKVHAEIAEFDVFLSGDVTGLTLQAETGGSTLSLEGRGGYAPTAFDGTLDARLGDLPALYASMGQSAPGLPRGLGRDRIMVSGQVTLTPEQSLHLRGGAIELDQNRMAGAFDADLSGETPRINGRITADALDFSALAAGEGADTGGQADGATGWPSERIDASALSAVNGQVAFSAGSLDLGTLRLGPAEVVASLDRSRAVFDLNRLGAYEGSVGGQFVMNNRSGFSVGGNLNAENIAMQPMLGDLAGYERLIGTGTMNIEFLGSGNSVDAIMKSLSGNGSLALGEGELRGLDLVGMLRNLDASFEGEGAKTIYDSITASFTISDGVLRNDDLAFTAPLATATGAGRVDIGNRTLDYRVVPTALPGAEGEGGVSVPVLITGPWEDPSFRPDLEYLLEQNLEEERRAAEERLRQEAEEALGVERQEGESVEDAVKRQVEEELEDRLRGLLGGD